MLTPAREATAATGASGLATSTARAATRIESSLRRASPLRPLRPDSTIAAHATGAPAEGPRPGRSPPRPRRRPGSGRRLERREPALDGVELGPERAELGDDL